MHSHIKQFSFLVSIPCISAHALYHVCDLNFLFILYVMSVILLLFRFMLFVTTCLGIMDAI